MKLENMTNVEMLALCGWMEDRKGIGFAYSVMHVVWNRVQSPDFPNTIHGVIYQPNAFSWTRPDNPEYGLVPSGPIYDACLQVAPLVIGGDSDPTFGALWYANLKSITPGGWFQRHIIDKPVEHPFLVKIGDHHYYA